MRVQPNSPTVTKEEANSNKLRRKFTNVDFEFEEKHSTPVDVCERSLPGRWPAKIKELDEMGKRSKSCDVVRGRCWFVARESSDTTILACVLQGYKCSTASTSRLVDMHAVQGGYVHPVPGCRERILPCRGRRGNLLLASPGTWVKRYHARGGRVEHCWWKLTRQLYGKRKAAKKFAEFIVTAELGLS